MEYITEKTLTKESVLKACENYPLYSQDGKGRDAQVLCTLFIPCTNVRYYITEANTDGDDVIMFGVCSGLAETEFGYFSFNELSELEFYSGVFNLKLRVRQIEYPHPIRLCDIKDPELQFFLEQIYGEE